MSGSGGYLKQYDNNIKIVGCQPEGAPSMLNAFHNRGPIVQENISTFVDGASMKITGDITFKMCQKIMDYLCIIPE